MLLTVMTVVSALFALGVCDQAGGFAGLGWLWLLPAGFAGGFVLCLLLCFLAVWISNTFYYICNYRNPFSYS